MNKEMQEAFRAFFAAVAKHGDGEVPEAAKAVYRQLGGDISELEMLEPVDEETDADPEPPAEDPQGDQQ